MSFPIHFAGFIGAAALVASMPCAVILSHAHLAELERRVGNHQGSMHPGTARDGVGDQDSQGPRRIAGPLTSGKVGATLTSPVHLQTLATRAANLCGVEPSLLHRLVARESAWNPKARSSSGAIGLGQLMPAAAREMGVTDRSDPWQNLIGSACYLRVQRDRFGSWRKALHAYHGGPNRTTTTQATIAYAAHILGASN